MGRVTVYCQPGAKLTQLAGRHDGIPKIRLKARPIDGEANLALRRWLANLLGVPLNAVSIESGTTSRYKRIQVEGVSDEALSSSLTVHDSE